MFKCEKCGACCRLIGQTPFLKSFSLATGECKWLDSETNLCKIYNKRPDICNIDKMYEMYYYKKYSKEEFYQINRENCKTIRGESYNKRGGDKNGRI
ncbi:MAG: YkgJ family cysteine cluster protein [Selenomonas ruminantium]|jgi:hypothetical protein|nr:YkgJ family cysteine cluster protein [Selenomonas ruminantium]